jgi:hypothetical protein
MRGCREWIEPRPQTLKRTRPLAPDGVAAHRGRRGADAAEEFAAVIDSVYQRLLRLPPGSAVIC